MIIHNGDQITFRGCAWDDGWEFDMPAVVYEPIKRYTPNGSNVGEVERLIEDICNDWCEKLDLSTEWDKSDLHEFKWRGWNPNGFKNRKHAWFIEMKATFKIDKYGLMNFKLSKTNQWYGDREINRLRTQKGK